MIDDERFKTIATGMGYDPAEVDTFLQETQAGAPDFNNTVSEMGYGAPNLTGASKGSGNGGQNTEQFVDLGQYDTSSPLGPGVPPLTQAYGARHSRYNNISGGVNTGTDFAAAKGTPMYTPAGGEWEVMESYTGARGEGPNNPYYMDNRGYGNSTLMKNTKTGEMIRTSHLSQVGAKPGDILPAGKVFGLSGGSGHVTGDHADVEYYNKMGQLGDVTATDYVNSLFSNK